MTDKKPAPRRPSKLEKPKAAEVAAPKKVVKVEAPKEEKPKTKVVKQPDPPAAKSVLPKKEAPAPVEPGPVPTVEEALDTVGIAQTLYGGGKIKRRIRTRKARYE